MAKIKPKLLYGIIGYAAGVSAMLFFPFYITVGIPVLAAIGTMYALRSKAAPGSQPLPQTESASAPISAAEPQAAKPLNPVDAEWLQVHEYIGTIEDMVILEGQQNNLDNEIVEKTLSLLSRLNRVIPQLRELNDSSINHNVKRLVLKDMNGVITPFLSLSGEAKQKNRRLLLNGLKDIDSKMTFYTETIEQKDLLELRTKAELIRQRYNTVN